MAKSGTLRVRIIGDSAPFERSLRGLKKSIGGFAKVVGAAGIAAAGAMAGFGVSSVKAASDLEQSVGAIESVFGPAASKIKAFGDTAAESFGLSRREVNETAAILGAQLQSMGFEAGDAADQVIELQERAADMAATFGGTTTDALESIASLMRGERDPIEKYGVAIKQADVNARLAAQGLEGLEGEAKKQAEAQAALSLLFDQTANSAGQFGRESETLAGKQARLTAKFENLRAEIGEKLLPVAVSLFDGLSKMIDKARPVVDAFFAGFSGNVNASADAMRDGQGTAVEWGRMVRDVFDKVREKAAEWAAAMVRFITQEVIPRIVRLKDAIAENGDRIKRIFGNIGRVVESVAGIFGAQWQSMADSATGNSGTIEQVVDAVLGVIEGVTDTVADVVEFFERNWPTIAEVVNTVSDLLRGDLSTIEATFNKVFTGIANFAARKMAEVANSIIDQINAVLARIGTIPIPGFGSVNVGAVQIGRVSMPTPQPTGGSTYRSDGPGGRFHAGGIITSSLPRAPGGRLDERDIRVQTGERVLSRREVAAGAGGGQMTINLTVNAPNYMGDKRDLGRAVAEVLREHQRRGGTLGFTAA